MRVIELRDDWRPENLALVERPNPEPGPGQALVRMKAASINYRDSLLVRGGYGRLAGSLPLIPLSDGAGEVVALGDGVSRIAVGDRVCPIMMQGWHAGTLPADVFQRILGGPLDGTLAEFMVVPAEDLVVLPDHLSDVEAACLPCASLTAWSAVVAEGAVKPGETVLVLGTGGVALFALLFAKASGARVIVTSKSDEKLERARALGADATINYQVTREWGPVARDLANGPGVDLVVETGGGGTLPETLRAVRPGGRISIMGVLAGGSLEGRLSAIVMRAIRLQGITVGSRADFEAMLRAMAAQEIPSPVDRVFGFEELHAALDHLDGQQHFGKVCLEF